MTNDLQFRPTDSQFLLNPFPWLAQMRREAPVYYGTKWQCWMAFRCADVAEVLGDRISPWDIFDRKDEKVFVMILHPDGRHETADVEPLAEGATNLWTSEEQTTVIQRAGASRFRHLKPISRSSRVYVSRKLSLRRTLTNMKVPALFLAKCRASV